MDKLWDAVIKIIPPFILLVLAGIVAAFLFVYYWRGYRNYGDAIHDHAFLTTSIILVAAACLYAINRADRIDGDEPPLVLIAYFRNDESDQARAAIGSQLESGLASLYLGRRTVVYLNSFITDEAAAAATAERYKATAVVYGPVVVREKETTTSFKIYFAVSKVTQPYAMLPLTLPRERIDDIVLRVAGAERPNVSSPGPLAPLISRIETLEDIIARLQAETSLPANVKPTPTSPPQRADYQHKYALVVASNGPDDLPKLAAAEKDGRDVTEVIRRIGFDVTTLLGSLATRDAVLHSLAGAAERLGSEDILIFYFTGHGYLPQDGSPLHLILSDFQTNRADLALKITDVEELLQSSSVGSALIILDSSYGKSGLVLPKGDLSSGRVIQVLAGTADREAGMATAEGGVFTRALIETLASADTGDRMSTQELYRHVTNRIQSTSRGAQHPQLFAVGDREIVLRLR